MNDRDVVIIGAGQAGAGVARGLREHGFPGRITVVGEEVHPPYERPPLSKNFASGPVNLSNLTFQKPDWWTAHEVTLLLGCSVESIDRTRKTVALSDGRVLDYGFLVIATGGRPRELFIDGTRINRAKQVRTIDDAHDLVGELSRTNTLCVVGGGFLGLEIAGSARQMGLDVNVLESGARLLSRVFPPELSTWLEHLHVSHGINVVCQADIESVVSLDAGRHAVSLVGGRHIDTDCLVACVGMEPNVQPAIDAGLVVNNGIMVDDQCRTSDSLIYAVGDVASQLDVFSGRAMRIESWQNAEHQAAVCAASITGAAIPKTPVPWFWSDQLGKNIQIAGVPQEWDELVWRGSPEQESFAVFLLHCGRLTGGITVNLGREMTPLRQLIELHAFPDPLRLARADCGLRVLVAEARAKASPVIH